MTQTRDPKYHKMVQQEITFDETRSRDGDAASAVAITYRRRYQRDYHPGPNGVSDGPESKLGSQAPGVYRTLLTLHRPTGSQDRTK
jgi:hypothetical protein